MGLFSPGMLRNRSTITMASFLVLCLLLSSQWSHADMQLARVAGVGSQTTGIAASDRLSSPPPPIAVPQSGNGGSNALQRRRKGLRDGSLRRLASKLERIGVRVGTKLGGVIVVSDGIGDGWSEF